MKRVAVVGGTGDLGFGLALRLAKAGYSVVIGSRVAEKAVKAAGEARRMLGGGVDTAGEENCRAVAGAEVVILSIPFQGVEGIVKSVKESLRTGSVVVSCIVPFNTHVEGFSSAAEYVSSLLRGKDVNVVAAYHTVSAEKLRDVAKPVGCDAIILGDDEEAKRTVAELTYGIEGLRPVDGGPLKNASIVENITALLISINKKYKIKDAGIRVTGLEDDEVRRRWME
ncbi:MAG TPA: NADPH-dependent F420 reductase [Candidatus Caldiarchaeum subterraneum]|uniref:NADPH-dependent F420 reductase n=1 Tax=Caldiarchaeum subterraneum TaxID=311458 RepID=A0A832ZZR5_CALS0|nr:NADPH-dependent F420 reductase [Candidatus Caldarchaeum subterraneum]